MSAIPEYIHAVKYFQKLQHEAGVKDNANILRAKWDMRDVYDSILLMNDGNKNKTNDLFKKLVRFFIQFSDDKSFAAFFKTYESYYESMIFTIEDRKTRKALREQTLGM